MNTSHPVKQGLYDPQFEHDACGIGFIAQMKGAKSHEIVEQALTILVNLGPASLVEDLPSAIAFTDGSLIGAVLDRKFQFVTLKPSKGS
jgi:glutamate synthase domain-containing protein 1